MGAFLRHLNLNDDQYEVQRLVLHLLSLLGPASNAKLEAQDSSPLLSPSDRVNDVYKWRAITEA